MEMSEIVSGCQETDQGNQELARGEEVMHDRRITTHKTSRIKIKEVKSDKVLEKNTFLLSDIWET